MYSSPPSRTGSSPIDKNPPNVEKLEAVRLYTAGVSAWETAQHKVASHSSILKKARATASIKSSASVRERRLIIGVDEAKLKVNRDEVYVWVGCYDADGGSPSRLEASHTRSSLDAALFMGVY